MTGRLTSPLRALTERPYAAVLIFLIAAIAVNALFAFTVLRRQASELESLEMGVTESRRRNSRTFARSAEKTALEVAAFKKGLPDEKKLTMVIGDILQAARRSGLVTPEGNYASETVMETGISRYSIYLPVEGEYARIKRFIYEIETLNHMLSIDELSLTGGKVTGGAIALKIKISVYFL